MRPGATWPRGLRGMPSRRISVQGLGFEVQGLGFEVGGFRFRVLEFRVPCLRVSGLDSGCKVSGLAFRARPGRAACGECHPEECAPAADCPLPLAAPPQISVEGWRLRVEGRGLRVGGWGLGVGRWGLRVKEDATEQPIVLCHRPRPLEYLCDEVRSCCPVNFTDSKTQPFHESSPSPWQQRSPSLSKGQRISLRSR